VGGPRLADRAADRHENLRRTDAQRPGRPQARATIPIPNGEPVTFEPDYTPPMGGAGAALNPLAYCFWGGLACYAMTYAQEAARRGVELRSLRARIETVVDQSRALGVSDRPPVEHIDWYLDVETDADADVLAELKARRRRALPGRVLASATRSSCTHTSTAGADGSGVRGQGSFT
jgi:uncharacterized OsmC-like protein